MTTRDSGSEREPICMTVLTVGVSFSAASEIINMPVTGSMPDLSWLADAPVFIDGQQVGAFYDAVVGPAFRTVELQVSSSAASNSRSPPRGTSMPGCLRCFPG